ncbi:hypothetical protein QUF63_06230 [Anaerolineales bacterium HSG25]|nr:hypothetical protein [Anaerolineales bacterium HSG25]
MVITEALFSELVQFINTHPKWRNRLSKALFPDLDIAKAFQNLAESQRQMQLLLQNLDGRVAHIEKDVTFLKEDVTGLKEDVTGLKEDVTGLKEDVTGLKEDVTGLKEDVTGLKEDVTGLKEDVTGLKDRVEFGFAEAAAERTEMKQDITHLKREMADVKGFNYEIRFIQLVASILGQFIRRGHDARNDIGLLLENAEDDGLITEQEHSQVLALDLLWKGKQKDTKADIVLAIELSWRVEETDIKRAVTRANILRKMGLNVLPVVAGFVWDETIPPLIYQHKVLFVMNKKIDESSWHNAFS